VSILPPSPRAVGVGRLIKKLLGALFLLSLGVGGLGGMGYYAYLETHQLLEDRALFASGTAATAADVDGTSRTRRALFHEYDLKLRYTDAAGVHHTARQQFDTVFGEVDKKTDVTIKYDPKDPSRASCSWAVDVTASRATWCVFAGLLAVLGGFLVYTAFHSARDSFLERRAARDGREVRMTLQETSRDQYGNVTYATTAEVAPGKIVKGRQVLTRKQTPWWVGGNDALGVYSDELGRAFVLEADGMPVVLTAAELAAAKQRATAG
jgi:hypothetical protein